SLLFSLLSRVFQWSRFLSSFLPSLALSQVPSFGNVPSSLAASSRHSANRSSNVMVWCPDSGGFGPSCPSPTDPVDAIYCCTIPWNGINRPSCCTFPVYTGFVIVLPIVIIVFFILMAFLTCHCWDGSPMNERRRNLRMTRGTEKNGVKDEIEMERFDREPYSRNN
ncbi:hypothetical protein PFISCL1PPCAC_24834, partial [Pristionchus fissidentatus]